MTRQAKRGVSGRSNSRGCRLISGGNCGSPRKGDGLYSLEGIARNYICQFRPGQRAESQYFARQPSLRRAVELASLSIAEDGKRHSHQRRIPERVLREAWSAIQDLPLSRCRTFRDLFDQVNQAIRTIRGIGPLAIYDVSTRIGSFLGLEPKEVHLHAGTLDGARALGLACKQRVLPESAFPPEWKKLKPAEIEDCLCIYKEDLERVTRRKD